MSGAVRIRFLKGGQISFLFLFMQIWNSGSHVSRNAIRFRKRRRKRELRIQIKAEQPSINYYTDAEWGKTDNYHLCIDSGVFGIDGTVTVLEACVNNRITPQK